MEGRHGVEEGMIGCSVEGWCGGASELGDNHDFDKAPQTMSYCGNTSRLGPARGVAIGKKTSVMGDGGWS
jgi:hypothetical protein